MTPHRLHDPRPGAPGPLVLPQDEAARMRARAHAELLEVWAACRAGLLIGDEFARAVRDASARVAELGVWGGA